MTAGLNILMMDDAPIIHLACRMIIFGSNYKQISIQDPEEALRYSECRNNYDKPDIIFVNSMMNHVKGTDIIREMRKDSYFDKIPIVLQTCYAVNLEGRRVLKELNIIHVLAQPYTKSQFLKCIDTYVGYFAEDNRSN